MARSRKHKADGLFYVTQKMLAKNYACYPARAALAKWQAALFNPKLTRSDLLLVDPCCHDDTRIPITIQLIRYFQDRSVGGVHAWLCRAVENYADESLDWQADILRLPDPSSITNDQKVMDILYLLAKRRGLIS